MKRKSKCGVLGWWFAASDVLPNGDGRKVVIGQTLTVGVEPECCERGLHASVRIIDAIRYAPGALIYRVRLGGKIDKQIDKLAATERTALWCIDGTRLLREFAALVARDALMDERKVGREPHADSWRAVEVALLYARGEATEAERSAAESAARSAAESAARSAAESAARSAAWIAAWIAARSAAWSAAWSAAESAAWSAALSAAESAAWSAALSAAEKRNNDMLTRMVLAAHRAGPGKVG